MADPFIAEIRIFPFKFAPTGWAWCDGQVVPVSQNTALFSLLGTVYGGNGTTNFALPNLQGRAPMHPKQGPGLSNRALGELDGAETVTVQTTQLPAHNHTLNANTLDPADTNVPSPNATFASSSGGLLYQTASNTQLAADDLATAGAGQPHNNMQPYLTLYFNIALQGAFPQRR